MIGIDRDIIPPKYVCLHNTTRRPINQELFTNTRPRLIIGLMDKITKVNVEGDEYGFVAGQTVKGVSGALSSDYVKHIILPEGAEVVEGMLVAVTFVNDNTAGYSGEKTVYSTDGINFYWDSGYTQLITLPPQGCYKVTTTETQYEYKLSEYPVLVMGDMTKPFCDSRGHPAGGKLWQAGDTVTVINLENRFIALQTTVNEIIQGSSLPVTSGAVYEKCNSLEPVDHVTSGNLHSVTSNATFKACSPNYAQAQLIYNGTSEYTGTFTALENGIIIGSGYGGGETNSYIYLTHDSGVTARQQGFRDENISVSMPVRKGDKINILCWLALKNQGLYFIPYN